LLRVKDDLRSMSPVSNANNYVGFEPAIIPFLFWRGFEMSRMDLDADFKQTLIEKAPLGRQP
jgi:hypothetical protein